MLEPAEGDLTTHRLWDPVQKPHCSSLDRCCSSSTWAHREINLTEYCLIRNWQRTDARARLSQSARILELFHRQIVECMTARSRTFLLFNADKTSEESATAHVHCFTSWRDSEEMWNMSVHVGRPECRMSHAWCVSLDMCCSTAAPARSSAARLNTHEAN